MADHPGDQSADARVRLQSRVSFYLCRDAAGVLRLVIVEVHNTHLERHLYPLRPSTPNAADRADEPFVASMTKDFYVSPFIDVDGRYTVHVADRPTELRIAIALRQDGAQLLATSLVLVRRPLRDRTIARMLLRHPLVTLTTIGRIHWHAWRLWRRGIPFQRHGIATRQHAAQRDDPVAHDCRGDSMTVRAPARLAGLPSRSIGFAAERVLLAAAERIRVGRLTIVLPDGRVRVVGDPSSPSAGRRSASTTRGRRSAPAARRDRGRGGLRRWPVVVAGSRRPHRAGRPEPRRPRTGGQLVASAAPVAGDARPSGAAEHAGPARAATSTPTTTWATTCTGCSSTRR